MVELGADVNAKSNSGLTALHNASFQKDNVANIETLVKKGANVNATTSNGVTALHLAAKQKDNVANIEVLVELGADVNITDNQGKTASSYAQSKEIQEFLDLGYHIQSDALFNDASYNLPPEVAGDSRVYKRYVNLLKREGINDVFALLREIEANETISGNGQEIIHEKIGSLIEDFLMDFASLLHHAAGIAMPTPLFLMVENPVGEESLERDELVEYYKEQAAIHGIKFSCDLMAATREEITPRDQMLLKQNLPKYKDSRRKCSKLVFDYCRCKESFRPYSLF